MTSAAATTRPGSEFDSFLFAPIGEDLNGLPLSLVSLFARMDLDPWQEAQCLAALPAPQAAARLTSSFDSLKDPVLRQASSDALVLRLIALLPRPVRGVLQAPAADVGAATGKPERGMRIGTLVFVTFTVVLMLSRIFAPHPPPAAAVAPQPAMLPTPAQGPPKAP